jgi:ubiquinol-cytochrome c reductase iron-sulfur subunit
VPVLKRSVFSGILSFSSGFSSEEPFLSYARLAVLLGISGVAAVGFMAAYVLGAQTQWEAGLLTIALLSLMASVILYAHEIVPKTEAVEERGYLSSGEEKNDAASAAFLAGVQQTLPRSTWLGRFFAGTVGLVALSALFPLRSLFSRSASPQLLSATSWRKGLRLVREDGAPVHASDLEIDSIITAFPEGFTGPNFSNQMTNDAIVVVRVPKAELALPVGRENWAPQGLLAFSKVCTHAGCPVALYRAAARQLFCPCHQSTFDVVRGAGVVFGPADRALPQLPLGITRDGFLVAMGPFSDRIGPGYWSRS